MTDGVGVARPGADRLTAKGPEVILTDAMVLTMDDQRRAFRNGYVWMKDGRIQAVGPASELASIAAEISRRSCQGRIVMPGLVNCHTHLGNGLMRGIYDEMPLEVWFAKGMWSVLNAMSAGAGEAGAYLSALELLSTGVTTTASGEICTPHRESMDGVITAVREVGIRSIISRIVMDNPDESSASQSIPALFRETPAQAADEIHRLQKAYNSDRISIVPEALGVLRCTPEMVQAMHRLAIDTNSHFTMHVASSQDERDESRQRFGHGSVAELEHLGVLGPRTLIAHAVWLDDYEIDCVAARQTGISHNPVANAYYAAGVARLADMMAKGVRVGLGVDGASTNNSQNVWETMKMAMLFQKQKLESANFGGAETALELMTRGGAAALHMEDEIGSLEAGKRADVIVIDPRSLPLAPIQTALSNLIYSNDPNAVRDVYVDGELLVSNGVHRSIETGRVLDNAERELGGILKVTGLDEYIETRSKWSWQ
ncbi:amidohydrolase family protein [Sphingobium chungbukense]|uniref:amidohydrolase family protein n=1 Tax=Sphingobium chungbukense TaxID=56193 RepID=UPI000A02DB02|nr:amidohydrolase family protein [Sphingobium chungbukense]